MNIFSAIDLNDKKAYSSLIQSLDDLSVRERDGQTLLHRAVLHEHTFFSRDLIHRGINVNFKEDRGLTPLHFAVSCANYDQVKLLLACGALPNQVDSHGNNALWTALLRTEKSKRILLLDILLGYEGEMNSVNNYGRSPLDIAMKDDSQEMKKLLKKYNFI